MRVTLVGLPGCGKSTVGQQLARRLQLAFVDSDRVIEERIGCSIRTYFDQQGEDAFRDIEERVIDELSAQAPAVIATGGGAVLRDANRDRLHQRTFVVYLQATPDELFRRLQRDTKRPLLQVSDPLGKLRELYEQRDPLYRAVAHASVPSGRSSVSRVADLVMAQLSPPGPGRSHAAP